MAEKRIAYRRLRRKTDGMNETIYLDAETGKEISPDTLEKYTILDAETASLEQLKLTPKAEENAKKAEQPEAEEKKSGPGKHDDGGEYYEGVDSNNPGLDPRSASNNFGYAREDKVLNALANTPNPIAPTQMGARLINNARRINNMYAVNQGRKVLGIEGDAKKKGAGQLGDIKINGKTYPVGYEALEPVKKDSIISKEDVAEFVGGTVGGMVAGPLGSLTGKVVGRQALKDDPKTEKLGRTNLTLEEARRRSEIAKAQGKQTTPTRGLIEKAKEVQAARTEKGRGLMDLSPSYEKAVTNEYSLGNTKYDPSTDLENRPRALDVDYHLGPKRSEVPSTGIEFKVADVVRDVLGPGYSVDVISGQEPEGRRPAGSAYRHPHGLAADLKIKDPKGRTLNMDNPQDAQAIKDVAQGMAARYEGNFGMGRSYMGPETMHMDTLDLSGPIAEQARKEGVALGAQWGGFGKTIADTLDMARAEGLMPRQYYDVDAPAPQARPEQETMVAQNDPMALGDSFVNSMGKTAEQTAATRTAPRATAVGFADLGRPTSFSDIDKLAMAKTLAGEIDLRRTDLTTPEGVQEANGIMSTIENRKGKYGSIKDVLGATKQYSTWNTDAAANVAETNYAKNPGLYDKLVNDYISNPQSNLGYTNYHADYATPGWSGDMADATQIGAHKFGTLPEYQGAFGTNFGRFGIATAPQNTGPKQVGAGTEAKAQAKATFSTAANTSASIGSQTSRGMASDENANRSTSSTSRESRDRSSGFSSRSTASSKSSSEGKGSYGSSGRSGYSSIGSSSGFSSKGSSSKGRGSYGSSGRSGYSSIGSDRSSGFGSRSRDASQPGGRVDRDEKGWK